MVHRDDPTSASQLQRAMFESLAPASRPAVMASRGAALRWLRRQQAAYVPSDREELSYLRRALNQLLESSAPFFSAGSATLYRAVLLPESVPWRETLRTERMGLSWTFDRAAARVYFTERDGDRNFDDALDGTIIEAVVGTGSVHWETTLIHTSLYEEEREVRLLPEQPLLLTAVGDERLSPPVPASTGRVTQRWHDRR